MEDRGAYEDDEEEADEIGRHSGSLSLPPASLLQPDPAPLGDVGVELGALQTSLAGRRSVAWLVVVVVVVVVVEIGRAHV